MISITYSLWQPILYMKIAILFYLTNVAPKYTSDVKKMYMHPDCLLLLLLKKSVLSFSLVRIMCKNRESLLHFYNRRDLFVDFTGRRISTGPRFAGASRRSVKQWRHSLTAVERVQNPPAGGRGRTAHMEGRAEQNHSYPGSYPWECSRVVVWVTKLIVTLGEASRHFWPCGQ